MISFIDVLEGDKDATEALFRPWQISPQPVDKSVSQNVNCE
ncbi:hypothetical protein [Shewanella sp.]